MIGLTNVMSIHAQGTTISERVTYGDSITRSFGAGIDAFLFNFYATAGDHVTLTLIARTAKAGDPLIDPALILAAPDGTVVAQNDDSLDAKFGLTNARLVNFPITMQGMYTVHATRDTTTPAGSFVFALKGQRVDGGRANLDLDQPLEGTLDSKTPTISYEFRATGGDVVSAEVDGAAGSNLSMMLFDQFDNLLVTFTAKPTGIVKLTSVLLRADTVYTLVIAPPKPPTASIAAAGFTVKLHRDGGGIFLANGELVSGTINAQNPETAYVIAGKAGEVVTITMHNLDNTLAAHLTLTTFAGRVLSNAQASAGADLKKGDARILRFKLPSDGIYLIAAGRVGGAKGTSTGAFDLKIELIAPTK